MTKTAGMGDRLFVGGVDLSGDIQALNRIGGGPATIDSTDITQSGYDRLGGLRDGSIEFVSYYDAQPAQAHPTFSALPLTDVILSYYRGTAIGNAAASLVGKQVNYDPTRGQDGSLTFAVQAQANGFGIEMNGQQMTAGRRVDGSATAAGAGNSFDTGASAAFGAQMYVHLFAFAGTSVTIKVQDSADNISFLDIAGTSLTTAALTTAPQAVRIAIPNTATVRRYIAVGTVGTFTNADFSVHVIKNATAGFVT